MLCKTHAVNGVEHHRVAVYRFKMRQVFLANPQSVDSLKLSILLYQCKVVDIFGTLVAHRQRQAVGMGKTVNQHRVFFGIVYSAWGRDGKCISKRTDITSKSERGVYTVVERTVDRRTCRQTKHRNRCHNQCFCFMCNHRRNDLVVGKIIIALQSLLNLVVVAVLRRATNKVANESGEEELCANHHHCK